MVDLTHITFEHQVDFPRIVLGWDDDIYIEKVDSVERTMRGGKTKSALGYILKAALPQSVRRDPRIMYRKSGTILGERVFVSRTLGLKAQTAW